MPDQVTTQATNNETTSTNMNQLIYPLDHESTSGAWLLLVEYDYSRPTIDSSFKPNPTGTSISLPIPMNLSASYGADWGRESYSAIEHQMIRDANSLVNNKDAINEWMKSTRQQSEKEITGSVIDMLKSGAVPKMSDYGRAAASDLITSLPIVNQVAASQGLARNPWLAAVFQGVDFRSWTFSYNFFPRSKSETDAIEKIYTALKYGMSPSYDEKYANNLFKYPNMYAPRLIPKKYLFDFGFCVITNVTINYHNEGAPVYFGLENDEKAPASMNLTFSIQEIEICTKESINPQKIGGKVAEQLQTRVDSQGNAVAQVTRGR